LAGLRFAYGSAKYLWWHYWPWVAGWGLAHVVLSALLS